MNDKMKWIILIAYKLFIFSLFFVVISYLFPIPQGHFTKFFSPPLYHLLLYSAAAVILKFLSDWLLEPAFRRFINFPKVNKNREKSIANH